jgi:hypothetical protein
MQDTLLHALIQNRCGRTICRHQRGGIALGDRLAHRAQHPAQLAFVGTIVSGLDNGLTRALQRRDMICHCETLFFLSSAKGSEPICVRVLERAPWVGYSQSPSALPANHKSTVFPPLGQRNPKFSPHYFLISRKPCNHLAVRQPRTTFGSRFSTPHANLRKPTLDGPHVKSYSRSIIGSQLVLHTLPATPETHPRVCLTPRNTPTHNPLISTQRHLTEVSYPLD